MSNRPLGLSHSQMVLLAAAAALGSLATQMLVPALPVIAHDLGVNEAQAQLIVTVYIAGLGVGQLVAGPIADVLGRKAVLLGGLALFCAASAVAALSDNIFLLVAARPLQALGGAACLVCSRVIVVDMSREQETAGHMATLSSIMLLAPIVGPSIGGAIAGWGNWRLIFVVLTACGLLVGALAAFRLPAPVSAPVRFSASVLLGGYRRLAASPRFRRYVCASTFYGAAMYIFLSTSPFLLIGRWGLKPQQAGLCYLGVTCASVVGTWFVRRLEARGGAFRVGLGVMVTGALVMAAEALAGLTGPVYLLAPMAIVFVGVGISGPAGIAGAMHAEPGFAGAAASLAGAFQMLVAAGVAAAVTPLVGHSFLLIALSILACATTGLLIAPPGRAVPGAGAV